jgi:hypothetical protein
MRTLLSLLILLLLILPFEECKAQYHLSVPFNNGFVGDNTAQNVSSNSVYMNSLGWSNIQFAQNSAATTFVSQGNDIVGFVLITDNNGVEHTIPGYVKWRAPSGTVTSLVFAPSATTVLATNGSNGSSTYTISTSKYIGLIFNGETLTIPSSGANTGKVSGNAATSGLLDQLNTYLAAFPYLTVPDYTVYESAGKILLTVSLSAVSTNTVSALYTSSDSTALSTSDYTSRSGSISFAPGELTKTVEIMITPDLIPEATEYFKVTFSDPKNASVQRGMSTITVLDDSPLGVDLISLNAVCEDVATRISWQTANEHSSDYFVVQGMNEFENWIELDEIDAAGESNELISYESFLQNNRSYKLFRLVQYDFNGAYTTHGPVALNCGDNRQEINVYPNPSNGIFSLSIDHTKGEETGSFSIVTLSGVTVFDQRITLNNGVNVFPIELNGFHPGIYYLLTTIDDKITSRQIVLQ